MPDIKSTGPAVEEVPTVEELEKAATEKKKKEDEAISKRLNDPDFLNFLQKHPEAVDISNDNEYVKEKIKVFESLQKVRKEVESFVTTESGVNFGPLADANFVKGLEGIAIEDPRAFLEFSANVSTFLESVKQSKSLEPVYQVVAKSLGIEKVDFAAMTEEEKIDFVTKVHDEIDQQKKGIEATIAAGKIEEKKKGKGAGIWFTTARKEWKEWKESGEKKFHEWKEQATLLNGALDRLKRNEQKLSRDSIVDANKQISSIKANLGFNVVFDFVRAEFGKKAQEKIKAAIGKNDVKTLSKQRGMLSTLDNRKSVFDSYDFDGFEGEIANLSKESLTAKTQKMVEGKGALTLSAFEREVENMKKDGLGLSDDECNELIAGVLQKKVEELENDLLWKQQEQNRIKIILIKRILINLQK